MVKKDMEKSALKARRKPDQKAFLIQLAGLMGGPDLLRFKPVKGGGDRQADSRLLAASEQYLAWIVGADAIDPAVQAMIKTSWDTRASSQARVDYLDAATAMATRIHGLRRRDFTPLIGALHAGGLQAPYKLIDDLLKRRALFERPAVVTPLAMRARFNTGSYIAPKASVA